MRMAIIDFAKATSSPGVAGRRGERSVSRELRRVIIGSGPGGVDRADVLTAAGSRS